MHIVPVTKLAALFPEAGLPEADHFPGLLQPLAGYLELLMQWNKVMNLVGPTTWQEIFRTLVVDSIHLATFLKEIVPQEAPHCWDLGAGAGLPGVVLRMIWQKGGYYLIEAREKRALFLSAVLAYFPLRGVRVFRGRAERFMSAPDTGKADLIVSRAFMPWPKVLDLVRPHIAPDGQVVFLLRENLDEFPCPGWRRTAWFKYQVNGQSRFFSSLVPAVSD